MKTLCLVILLALCAPPLLPGQSTEGGKPGLPDAASAGFHLGDSNQDGLRVEIHETRSAGASPYRIGKETLNRDELLARIVKERALRKDSGRLSDIHLVVHADQRSSTTDFLALLQTCADPKTSIWKIWLAASPREGDLPGLQRRMPLHLPTDFGLESDEEQAKAKTRRKASRKEWQAALATLPRGTAFRYHFEHKAMEVAAFARKILALKTGKADSVVTMTVPGDLLVGDLVGLIDFLRMSGFETGGADDTPVEIFFRAPSHIGIKRAGELRIDVSPSNEFLLEEEIVEEEEMQEEEVVEEPVVVDEEIVVDEEVDAAPQPRSFGGRRGGRRHARRGRGGRSQMAVDRGLEWLALHQSPDGSWDTDGFMKNDKEEKGPPSDGKGQANYDVASTGLAILAFLGAGETHKAGQYKRNVAKGLKWLREQQDQEGCFGSRKIGNFTYNHAIGTLAMTEAYGLTKSPLFKSAAKAGIDFALQCQNPYFAWRYGKADGQNDTSVTGWMIMALKSAKAAGFEVDQQRFSWALDWIEEMTDEESGRTGYIRRGEPPVREVGRQETFPAQKSEALTALGILTRIFCGQDPRSTEAIKKGAALLTAKPPVWNQKTGVIDMYYWHFGTLALFQVGGEAWKTWHEAIPEAITEHQRQDGNFAGSWDPIGAWGDAGGRVYSTALMTLSLEVYYRYGRVFGTSR